MSIYKLLIQLIGQDKGATRSLRGVSKEVTGLERQASGLSSALQMVGAMGFAYMGKQAIEAVWGLGELGAAAMRTEAAFKDLAAGAGGSASDILNAIKRATGGTVSEMDAMAAANKGILLGLGANAKQWEELTDVARSRARAMGLTTTQALNDITTGIGRESRMILDNLGIVLDMEQVMDDYAESIGKTAKQLDAAERKQAMLTSVISTGREEIEAAGGITDDYSDSIERMNAALEDLKVAAGEKAAPAVGYLAEQITDLVEGTVWDEAIQVLGFLAPAALTTAQAYEELAEAQMLYNQALALGIEDQYVGPLRMAEAAYEATVGLESLTSAQAVVSSGMKAVGEATAGAVTELDPFIAALQRSTDSAWDMWGGLRQVGMAIAGMVQRWKEQFIRDAAIHATEEGRAAKDSARAWESAYSDIRSTIESALSPTNVTAGDMALGDDYVDNWDESARRLNAIAKNGFAELQAHADWASVLKIPDHILAGSEAGLKDWAARTSKDVTSLFRPDLLNIDAAVAAVEQAMRNAAAKELSIDMIVQAMGAKGTSVSKEEVAQMLGLDQALVGGDMASQIMQGFSDKVAESDPTAKFSAHLRENTKKNKAKLSGGGFDLWNAVEQGIYKAINETDYALKFARRLAPLVAKILGDVEED